jgi:hypothetical protein
MEQARLSRLERERMSDYKQGIIDAIYQRELDGTAIFKIASEIEKIIREQVAQEIEQFIDADHEARAFTTAANRARGRE